MSAPGLSDGLLCGENALHLWAFFWRRYFVRSVSQEVRGDEAAGYRVDSEGSLFESYHTE